MQVSDLAEEVMLHQKKLLHPDLAITILLKVVKPRGLPIQWVIRLTKRIPLTNLLDLGLTTLS